MPGGLRLAHRPAGLHAEANELAAILTVHQPQHVGGDVAAGACRWIQLRCLFCLATKFRALAIRSFAKICTELSHTVSVHAVPESVVIRNV